MSLRNLHVRLHALPRRACCLIFFLMLAILFTAGCAGTKMAATSTASPTPAGSLSVSASSVNFGSVAVGSTKSTTITLSNNAAQTATVQVSQVTISGQAFSLTGVSLPASLAPGHSLTLTIDFKPSAAGSATGTVAITSDAATANISVALSGSGMASGQLAANPATMTFSAVAVGSSQNQSGNLTAGSSPITVSSANWQGSGFSLSGITFPVTIPSGQSVPFTVTFAPQAAGTVSGAISFVSNASNSPLNEALAGTGQQSATPHSVDLSWNPDASSVQGYYVYRGNQTGGPYTKISALLPATSYVDASISSGLTYYYVVTALGSGSSESGYSNEAVAVIP
jgi:Abnormal spindle-like microcephaly-assoc'd, ASPM-SPD-2-Hydin